MNTKNLIVPGVLLTAALSLATVSGASAADAPAPVAAPAAASASPAAGAQLLAGHSTSVHVTVTNNTGQDLTLVDDYKPYGDWQDRFAPTLRAGEQTTAYATSLNIEGVDLAATYAGADGTSFHIGAYVPVVGFDSSQHDVTGSNAGRYTIHHSGVSGYNPSVTFTLDRL